VAFKEAFELAFEAVALEEVFEKEFGVAFEEAIQC